MLCLAIKIGNGTYIRYHLVKLKIVKIKICKNNFILYRMCIYFMKTA